MDYTKKITLTQEGQKFLRQLGNKGKLFHLDDDVSDCFKIGKDGDLTLKEANLLTERQQELRNINWGIFEDCHSFVGHIDTEGLDNEGNFWFKPSSLNEYKIKDIHNVFNIASKSFDHKKYFGCTYTTGALTFGHIDDVQEHYSGGGFHHLFILLQSGHIISHHKETNFLEVSEKTWNSISDYIETENEDGFGCEPNNDNHENRSFDFSLEESSND